jgi:2-dehydro-3-deoxyphosphogluconate aldolase/(4S)-4-hydroxy-2-oxoglutarate aldolase
MSTTNEKIGQLGLVPVVVFDKVEDALPTAAAMIKGGLPIMEVTLRTEAGLPSIKAIKDAYPEIIMGAGTVLSVEQAKASVEAGAEFIVSPGFNDEVVSWCKENDILITPGCVTPTEIEHALSFGLNVLKFFPASLYGGINGCKALYGPYRMVKFVPTGGVSLSNLSDYADKNFVHAIGGGWLANPADIAAGNFDKITATIQQSIDVLLGFEVVHVGVNTDGKSTALAIADELDALFNMGVKNGNSSNFVGTGFEILNSTYIGDNGHIAIRTNSIDRALYYLEKRGYTFDMSTLVEKNGKKIAVYLNKQIGGFGIHLLQK